MSFTTRVVLILSLLIAAAATARADLVTDWNVVAYDIMRMANVDGAPAARALAIMHVSQADAVNTIQNRHTRYAYQGKLQPDASSEAAAASAAHNALLALFPAQRARIEEVYVANLRALADGPKKIAGETIGAEKPPPP